MSGAPRTFYDGSGTLRMWTVYEGAKDIETRYCARLWLISTDGPVATLTLIQTDAIEDLRDQLAAEGLTRLARHPEDDPAILEVWL